jgi:broad specificity phosphatase PhoE
VGVLLLVRHGQASLGAANYDQLSELGHRQARATGARLARADLVVDRVICGALARQRETAAEVMAMMPDLALQSGRPGPGEVGRPGPGEVGPDVDDRLDEYDHVGVLAGLFGAEASAVSFEGAGSAGSGRGLQPALDEAIARWATADTGSADTGSADTGSAGAGYAGAGYGESHGAFIERVHAVLGDLTGAPGCTLAVTSGGVIAVACAQVLGLPADRWPTLARIIVNGSVTKIISGRTGTNLLTFNDYAHLEGDRSLVTYR